MGFNQKINDSMNNMSRSVTTQMMKDAPPDLKYVYIGPVDEKTRPFCLDAAAQGALTEAQILELGGEYAESLVSGGGINCRHNWELASDDIQSQFHRGGEAQKILDAKPIPVVKKKTFSDTNIYKDMTAEEFTPIWEEWRERLDFGKEPLSREEAFHQWGSYRFNDYKNEFLQGKLTSKTKQYMDEVFRNVDGDWTGKEIYRGMQFYKAHGKATSESIDYFKSLKKGDSIKMDAPQSFSKNINMSKEYVNQEVDIFNEGADLKVMIRAKKVKKDGYDIERLSLHQSEEEVLIRPNSKFKITNISKQKYGQGYRNNAFVDDIEVLTIDIEPL